MKASDLADDPWFVTVQEALAGDYSLERELGRGGMGIVYLAREVALDRLVALKVLPPELAGRSDLRERFLTEARTAARLSHPNIVPIHRVGAVGRVVFFAMAYIDGETLGARLRKRGPLPGAEVMQLVKETAWALAYAHRQGVVHRDVKPDNILIEARTGRVVVADFGIAQVSEQVSDRASARVSANASKNVGELAGGVNVRVQATQVSGTAQFMSPEQALGDVVDGRSDLYALGVLAYLCVSGRLPFDHENASALLAQHVNAPVPVLARGDVPVALSRVIARCLEKAPNDRFASGEALVDVLDAAHANRRQVAPALIKWAEARDPFVPMYLMWDLMWVTKGAVQLAFAYVDRFNAFTTHRTALMLLAVTGMVLVPWVASFGFHLVRSWRMIRVGYGISDLRDAIRSATEREREVQALDDRWSANTVARLLKVASVVSIAVVAVMALAPGVMFAVGIREWWLRTLLRDYSEYVVIGAGAVIWASSAYGIDLPGRSLIRRLRKWRDRMWQSPFGARMAGWLSKIAPQQGQLAAAVDRPTEMALELASQRIFDELPTAIRLSMPEFPRVLEQLAQVAARARERQRALLDAERQSVEPDGLFSDALAKAERDLSEAVQAMERLRIGVMRLYARAGSAEHHTVLQHELHLVTAQLARLDSADADVERLLAPGSDTSDTSGTPSARKRKRRWWPFAVGGTSTPTPTPAT